MEGQIYLCLVPDCKYDLAAPLKVPIMLKDMVFGDSLDVPFMKFIRVNKLDMEVAVPGESTDLVPSDVQQGDTYQKWEMETSGHDAGSYARIALDADARRYRIERQQRRDVQQGMGKYKAWRKARKAAQSFEANAYLKAHLPEHGGVTIAKNIDVASPRLAYFCSRRKLISHAMFFFRRKIGLGIGGVRFPFLVIGLRKCLINSWEMDGFNEKISMDYQEVAWCSTDPFADTNVPTGWRKQYWDDNSKKGGSGGWATECMTIALALVAAGGVAAAALGAAHDGGEEASSREER